MSRRVSLAGGASRRRLVVIALAAFLLLLAAPLAFAGWMKINTNDGQVAENLGAALYTSTCSDATLANYLEIKNVWAVNDGAGFYFRLEACAAPAAGTETTSLRIGAGFDCNNDGDVADPYVSGPDGDRKAVYWPNADQVWLYSGTNQQIVQMADGTYGERVTASYDWWIPLDKLPPDCRASSHTIGLALATAKIVGAAPVTQDESPLSQWNHPIDYGDAINPDPVTNTCTQYRTRVGCNGARHGTAGTLRLGALEDPDGGNTHSADANGDDLDNQPDEDGVVPTLGVNWAAGGQGSIDATVSGGSGFLNCWVDWGNNGNWSDAGDKVVSDAAVAAGMNTRTFSVPAAATFANSFIARCRLAPGANQATTVTGATEFGEVEDHKWVFGATGNRPAPVTLAAGVNGASVRLSWTNIASDESYLVLSGGQPYFNPGDPGVTTTPDPNNSSPFDTGAIVGAPAESAFYAVQGQVTTSTPDLVSGLSNRVGLFEVSLVAGL